MIDNKEKIKSLINFGEKGQFYQLYILVRKKDQPDGEKDNHQSVRTIKSYSIDSFDYLDKRWEEIKMLCEVFRARAYMHVQGQNHRDVGLNMMISLAERLRDGNFNQRGLFDSVVGQVKTKEKYWIVDLDSKDPFYIADVETFIDEECKPIGNKVIKKIPTKNGVHLITHRFDVMEFKKRYPEVDIAKKNPTLLYYPNSLEE